MPGLNQLKQFTTDILNLGDETKIRAARGEKPVRAPFPKNVSEEDDSEDFANGMPRVSEDDISQAEAAAAEKESSGASSDSANLPDVSDILGMAGDLDLDDTDLSEFELPGDEAPAAEPEQTPIEDLDLDTLLQMSGDDGQASGSEDAARPVEEPDDDFDVTSLLDDSEKPEAAAAPGGEEAKRQDDFNRKLDGLSGQEEVPAAEGFDIGAADMDFEDSSASIDIGDALPDDLKEIPDPSAIPAEDGLPPLDTGGDAAEAEMPALDDLDGLHFDGLDSAMPEEAAPPAEGDAAQDGAAGDGVPDGVTDAAFALPDDMMNFSEDDLVSDIPDLDMSQLALPEDDIPGDTDAVLGDIPSDDVAMDLPQMDTGLDLPGFDLDSPDALPSDGGTEKAVPEDGAGLSDGFSLDGLDDLTTEEAPAADSAGNDEPESLGLDAFDDIPMADVLQHDVTGEDDGIGDIDTSGMDGIDFSAGAGDFDMDNITGSESEFHIPGFSDTTTADLNKKEEAPLAPAGEAEEAKKPKNTFTDAEYKRFLSNLEQYPLNVRMAVEDFVVKNEFTDDAVFEVLDKILRKVPARQVAADLEKKLDISLQVPRDFERRSAEEYEAYKKTLEYQLKNRIIPVAILSVMALVLAACIWFMSNTFIIQPSWARKYYKQGYAFIQENQYPQSEDSFNEALRHKSVKAWFYRYAERYREHRQYERARNMYNQILRRYDHDKPAGLAWAKMEAGDLYNYEEAERILKREVLDYHVNDADAILQLGDLYLDWATDKDSSKFDDAKEQYDLLMQLYGGKKDVKTYLARQMRYYIRTDNLAQVLQYKEQSFPKNKDLPAEDLIELSGYLLGKRYGDLPPSEEGLRSRIEGLRGMLEDAVKAAPGSPYALYNMGQYFMNTNNGKRAGAFFQQTLDMFKAQQYRNRRDTYKYIDTFRLLGEEYVAEHEYILAEETYGEGIELFEKENASSGFESTPDIGRLYSDMGDIDYFISGDMETSLANYIKAVNNKNDTPSVRYRIGYIQYKNRNYPEALGSFIRSSEGSPNDSHVLLSLANTLSLRDDNYAAEGYYERLLDVLQLQRERYNILLPQVRADQADIVDTYLKATNNLGVTLFRIAQMTGDSKKNAESIVHFNESLKAWDALTRNQETMVRLEGSNLAAQNIKYVTEPYAEYEPGIYTDIPKTMNNEEGLE